MFRNKKAFGDVVSALIMFIAVVGVSTGLVISFKSYVDDTQSSLKVQNDISSTKLKTSFTITNIYFNASSNELNVYVKNIGKTKLYTSTIDLFLDDLFVSGFTTLYANNFSEAMTVFQPQDTMVIQYTSPLASGTHEVRVVSEYGNNAEDSFNI